VVAENEEGDELLGKMRDTCLVWAIKTSH